MLHLWGQLDKLVCYLGKKIDAYRAMKCKVQNLVLSAKLCYTCINADRDELGRGTLKARVKERACNGLDG